MDTSLIVWVSLVADLSRQHATDLDAGGLEALVHHGFRPDGDAIRDLNGAEELGPGPI